MDTKSSPKQAVTPEAIQLYQTPMLSLLKDVKVMVSYTINDGSQK